LALITFRLSGPVRLTVILSQLTLQTKAWAGKDATWQTWPSWRRAASWVTALYKHLPPDGGWQFRASQFLIAT